MTAYRVAAGTQVNYNGDVFVEGEVISSRRGELSIMVSTWQIAAKAVLPLPNMYADLSEESRVRSRFLDLIVRDRARQTRHLPELPPVMRDPPTPWRKYLTGHNGICERGARTPRDVAQASRGGTATDVARDRVRGLRPSLSP